MATVPPSDRRRHLQTLETVRPVMAKAPLNPIETGRVQIGRAVQRMCALAGVSQKEAAALLERDPAQVARWISGAERAQVDALFAVARFRQPFIVALSELAGGDVEIETIVRLRKAIA